MMGKNKRPADELYNQIEGLLSGPPSTDDIDWLSLFGENGVSDIFGADQPVDYQNFVVPTDERGAESPAHTMSHQSLPPVVPVNSLIQMTQDLNVRSTKKRKFAAGTVHKPLILVGGNDGTALGDDVDILASNFGDYCKVKVKQQVHYLENSAGGQQTNIIQAGNNFTITVYLFDENMRRFEEDMTLKASLVLAINTNEPLPDSSLTGGTVAVVEKGVAKLTMKAQVLSSKFDNQLFRVVVQDQNDPSTTFLCEPVKIISKVTQALRRSIVKADLATTAATSAPDVDPFASPDVEQVTRLMEELNSEKERCERLRQENLKLHEQLNRQL